MAVTVKKDINIKNGMINRFPMASAEVMYSGTLGVVNESGYAENADTASIGKVAGVVYMPYWESTGYTATANGTVVDNSNCVDLYTEGSIDSIPFDSLTQADVGKIAYVYDNYTLTVDPELGKVAIGTVTKYYSSTKGQVELNGFFQVIQKAGSYATSWSGSTSVVGGAILSLANPRGKDVMVTNYVLDVQVAGKSTGFMNIGIANSSATDATNLLDGSSSGAGSVGSIAIWYPANESTGYPTVSLWKSTEFLTITNGAISSSGSGYFAVNFTEIQ